MSDKSVFQLINDLVLNLENRSSNNRIRLVSTVYENLLSSKNVLLNKHDRLIGVDVNTLICYLRLVLSNNALADNLETLFAQLKLESKKNSTEDIENILKFLCSLNNFSVSRRDAVGTIINQLEPLLLKPASKPTFSVLNVEQTLPVSVLTVENFVSTCNFPVLPSSKETDEGYFEEGASHTVALLPPQKDNRVKVNEIIDFWTDPSVLSGCCIKKYSPPKIYLSEAEDCIFPQIYAESLHRFNQADKIAPVTRILTYDCFKRQVKNLMFGVESELFPQDKISNKFYMKPWSTLNGLSIECLYAALIPLINAGNEIFYISNIINEAHAEVSPVLRCFFVCLRREVQSLQETIDSLCDDSSHGVLELIEKLKPSCEYINCIYELLLVFNEKQKDVDITSWLLDTLFGLCTSFNFSLHNDFFQRIFRRLSLVYLSYIDNWLMFGNCSSSGNSDFFVDLNNNYFDCRDRSFWNYAFSYVERRVPSVFQRWSSLIFNAGKLTNLMRLCKTSTNSFHGNFEFFRPVKFSLTTKFIDDDEETNIVLPLCDFSNSSQFQEILNDTFEPKIRSIEQTAANCILKEFKLIEIFNLLRDLYMGANGFFMVSMTETLFPLFLENIYSPVSTDLLSPLLTRALDECLETSRVKRNILVSVGLVMSSGLNENDGEFHLSNLNFFDTLELHCQIPWPCNIVVTDTVLNWCKKIFRFLLTLRWTISSLNDVWNYLKSSNSDTCFLNRHRLMLCQREMVHFVKQLETYILHQTVDVCWCDFWTKLNSGNNNFESIMKLHNNYMNSVVARCLLNPKAQRVYDHITRLLECCLLFRCRVVDDENEIKAMAVFNDFKIRAEALITVVEKLASRGYQRHLNDLLLWLNFNEFYFKMPNN